MKTLDSTLIGICECTECTGCTEIYEKQCMLLKNSALNLGCMHCIIQ